MNIKGIDGFLLTSGRRVRGSQRIFGGKNNTKTRVFVTYGSIILFSIIF